MSFLEILGQDRAVSVLRHALANDRLAHAYLFVGPDGVGKKLTALTLAQAIFCQQKSFDPCDKCPSCFKVKNRCHPDLFFLSSEGASIKIDQIRGLQKQISLKGIESHKKLAILDGVEKMTPEAANAFLKTLEEPPVDAVIILITAQPSALLGTVISRCQLLRFLPLPKEKMVEILKRQSNLTAKEAYSLFNWTDEGMGHALDLANGSIDEKVGKAAKLVEFIDSDILSSLFDFSKDFTEERVDVEEILWILQLVGRRALLRKFECPEEDGEDNFVWKIFKPLPRHACLEVIDIIQKTKVSVAKNANIRLALEVLVLELRRIREKFAARESSKI